MRVLLIAVMTMAAALAQDESLQKETARLYYASDDVTLSVPDSCPDVHWRIVDWRGRTVRECATPEKSRVYAGRLPPGYWCVKADERTMTTLTVVVDPASRRRVETSPYGVDSALSWVGSPKHFSRRFDNSFRHVVWLMQAAGIVETRERLSWSETQKTADAACAWGFYRDNAEMCRKAGIGLSGVFHDSPEWSRTDARKKGRIKRAPDDLLALYRYCRSAAKAFGTAMSDWEVWNEAEGEIPAWELAWIVKTAALGYRDGCPGMHVTSPATTADLDCAYDGLFFSNHMFKYADIFNTHSYIPLGGYEKFQDRAVAMLARNGCASVPVMITECGTEVEGLASGDSGMADIKCHSPEQEMAVADFIPKSQILRQVGGVLRNYFFVFGAYNERGGRKDWGILRRDGSAKPGVAALAALTSELQGLECLGSVDLGPGISAYAYQDSEEMMTLAFWGRGTCSVPCAGETARLTDWCGTPRTLGTADGRVKVDAEEHVSYLRGRLSLSVKSPVRKAPAPKPYVAGTDEDLTVVLAARLDPADFGVTDGNTTAELKKPGAGRVTVEAWNFSDRMKRGAIFSKNGELTGLPEQVEIPAWGIVRLPVGFVPKLNGGDIADWKLRGVFDGRKTSVLHIPVRDVAAFLKDCRTVEPDWRNDAVWSVNDSAPVHSMTREADGSVRFDATWENPLADRWCYPTLRIPEGVAKGARILEYEVRSWQEKVENDFKQSNVFVSYRDGNERLSGVLPPVTDWEVRRVGLPRGKDATTLRSVSLGGGHPKGLQLKVWIRNVKLYVE